MRMPRFPVLCVFGAALVEMVISAGAQVVAWNNPSGGSWSDSSDWNPMNVPTTTESASITLVGKYSVAINSDETVESLLLDSASASVAVSSNLTLLGDSGSSAIAAGTLTLSSARVLASSGSGTYKLSNAGTILSTSGTNFIYGNGGAGTGMAFTNTGRIAVTRGTLYLGNGSTDTVLNAAAANISVGAGATLNLNGGSTSIDNQGTLQASGGGIINIMGQLSTADLGGTISDAGSTINIEAILTNTSSDLAAPSGGAYTLDGGTIVGGTVSSGALTFGGGGGTLSGASMNGNFTAPAGATFTASGDTTFGAGTTTFAPGATVRLGGVGTALTLGSDATWMGDVAVTAGTLNLAMVNNGTIKSSISSLISGGGNNGFSFTNYGLVDSTGGTLSIVDGGTDVFTNAAGGTVEAGGGNVTLGRDGAVVSNLSGGALSGGTWIASGSSTMNFVGSGGPLVTSGPATTVELVGTGSGITSGPSGATLEQTLTTNNGTLEILGGRDFASTSAGITNNGALRLGGGVLTAASLTNGPGSTLSGFGTLDPVGGVTVGAGALISPGTAASGQYVGTLSFGSHGADLGSAGAYAIDIMNGTSPTRGVDNDTIDVAGTLTVSATAAGPFTLSLESINPVTGLPGMANFSSAGIYQWTLLSATSISGFNPGDFTVNTSAFSNSLGGGSFFVSASSTDIFLNFTPVPEPSTWALMAVGLAATGAVSVRRRRGAPRPA
jgi:hypothetical protein